jgi:hypothetical protein
MSISADLQEAAQKRLQMFVLRSKVSSVSLTQPLDAGFVRAGIRSGAS